MDLDLEEVGLVREYISDKNDSVLDLGETSVRILKADIKERKGEATLIFRYQLI